MLFTELRKYHSEFPLVELFEDMSYDAFILLLNDTPLNELNHIVKTIPSDRYDILSIINEVVGLQIQILKT